MQHLFIPSNLALEMKSIGFDEPCLGWWFKRTDNKEFTLSIGEAIKSNLRGTAMLAPLYQQVVDWFREKHQIIIQIRFVGCVGDMDKFIPDIFQDNIEENNDNTMYNYYAAFNDAIQEAIKLIKQ